jgi:imidazolonepropionase-like amidohydrolase
LTTIIKVSKLIDGTGRAPKENVAIAVEGNQIIDIFPIAELDHLGENDRILECLHTTAMPGIIDCHDHLAHLGLDLKERLNTPSSLAVLKAGKWVTETLMNGVTTVRDSGGVDLGLKMAVEQNVISGPRLIISLAIISQTGGHADRTQPSGQSTNFPILPGIPDGNADGVENVRHKVREIIRMGADWIKVATTGGIGSSRGGPTIPQFTLEELKAIVDEAHRTGKPVQVHAHGGEGLKMCIEAGVDSIEHGTYADEDDLRRMAEKGIWLVPTLSIFNRMLERINHDPESVPKHIREKIQGVVEAQRFSFTRAMELGVPIAMGTDAGALGHGQNAKELVYMVESGMSPMQAIMASTQRSAQLLKMSDQLGTLEPGKLADLILIEGDPLADISVVADPSRLVMVMKNGVIYKNKVS